MALVVVITGTSGAGKGTLEKILLQRRPDIFELAVSATTRERRPAEREGREYYFVSESVFEQRVKETIPGAVTVFVDAPSFDELERRLRERATESSGEIQVRLDLARKQREQRDRFDYVIVNDDVERAADELQSIVEKELHTAGTMSRP